MEEKYKMVIESTQIESIPFASLILHFNGDVITCNSECKKLFKDNFCTNGKEAINRFLKLQKREGLSLLLEMVQVKGIVRDFEMDWKTLDGGLHAVGVSASLILGNERSPIAVQLLVRYLEKDKMFFEQMKTELKLLRCFFDNIPMGVAIKSKEDFILTNDTLTQIMNYPNSYLFENYLSRLLKKIGSFCGKDRKSFFTIKKRLLTGKNENIIVGLRKHTVSALGKFPEMEIFIFERENKGSMSDADYPLFE